MIYELVAAVPYFAVGLGSCLIVLMRSCELKVDMWKFQMIYWGKILLINILFQTVIKYYYGNYDFFAFLEMDVALIWLAVIPFGLRWAFREPVTKSLLMLWCGDAVALVTTAVIGGCANLLLKESEINAENTIGLHTLLAAFASVIWLCILSKGFKRIFTALHKLKVRHRWLIWLTFIIYFSFSVIITVNTSLKNGTGLVQSNIITAILGVILIGGSIIYLKREQEHLKKENQNLIMQKNLVETYNAALLEQIDLTRKFRHDIRNHIQTLEDLIKCNAQNETVYSAIIQYAGELNEQCKLLKPTIFCSSVLINSVINTKISQCDKANIKVDIDVKSLEYGCVSDYEMISLLFNLFDNAIESCLKKKEKDERFIELTCHNSASWLIIRMENSMGEEIEVSNGRPLTTKKNKYNHGIGISIIEDIVKKYNGVFQYQAVAGIFTVRIAMETENSEGREEGENENRNL